MKRHSRIALVSALAFFGTACADRLSEPVDPSQPAAAIQAPSEPVMPGEVLLKLQPGADVTSVLGGQGLVLQARGYQDRFLVARGGVGLERVAAAALRGDARVVWAEPNYLRQTTAVNSKLWAFYNPGGLNMKYTSGGQKGQFIPSSYASIADADEDNIEGYAAGGADVVIGSIDTGVDLLHPEFTGRLIAGKDWYNNDNDPTDDDGHGSHTTGTMAGSTVGVAGVSGASPHVKVYVQKVCGRRGCPTSAIVSAIYAAADYAGMVAMNLSLGGTSESQAEKDAINYAVNTKSVLVIASAGNSGSGTVACPACDPNAISVAATNWKDEKTSYSQYGPGLDIAAPGGQCYSNTTPEGCIYSAYNSGGYAWLQGTSMAAPQVTGTAAIVASITGLRGAALRSRIESTADDKGASGYDQNFGNGRLNSYRAVTGSTLPSPQ